jgi:hypothetical protein
MYIKVSALVLAKKWITPIDFEVKRSRVKLDIGIY